MKLHRILFLILCGFLFSTNTFAAKRQMEYLDRGLIAVKVSNGVFLSWRLLGNESSDISFNVYKNGSLLKSMSATEATNLTDAAGTLTSSYVVKAVINGVEEEQGSKEVIPWGQQYLTIQLDRPAKGITPPNYFFNGSSSSPEEKSYPNGQEYAYVPNDCSTADLDGDGEYEIIVKWDPTNSMDNSFTGISGPVYIDAYKLDGTKLWRIDLGKNIRAGAHYTQFLVYDFDGDGKAEIICKTAPGTKDGKGNFVIMGSDDPNADYRTLSLAKSKTGFILSGPEYLTVFNGETGAEINTVAYKPARGTVSGWGDSYGNRVDRFLACVAYLDGVHPSAVMCRGYYTRATLTAYDFKNGKLVERWFHDSPTSGSGAYGQGNHNLSVADVDEDGMDEIIYGSCAIDHDGKLLYRTGYGHGDAMHVSDLDPDRPGLEVWEVHEESSAYAKYGFEMHDARTGAIIWGKPTSGDNGRGCAADIDPNYPGFEMWSTNKDASGASIGIFSCKGVPISTTRPAVNFRIYWDGDLQDELLDGTKITKWNATSKKIETSVTFSGVASCNGSKATPNLSADLFGDWREEVILWETKDSSKLRIYTTTIATTHRLYTLMHDPVYRLGIAWQNVAYNQPPHLGFYIGGGLNNIPRPEIYIPQTDTHIREAIKQSNLESYIDENSVIHIAADKMIQSVSIYTVDGRLLYYNPIINENNLDINSLSNSSNLIIIRIVFKDGEITTSKLMNPYVHS